MKNCIILISLLFISCSINKKVIEGEIPILKNRMRASHIIYGVDDLPKAVKEWQEKGFYVEYGQDTKDVNALIYFSEGPFIELINAKYISTFQKKIFSLLGWKPLIDRMSNVEIVNKNIGSFCIEKDAGNLDEQIKWLEAKYNEKGFYWKKVKRNDIKGNKLRWKLFFPNNLGLPFLMSYYENVEPKPKNFVHPNGVTGIKKLTLVTDKHSIEILKELVDDNRIIYQIGNRQAEVVDIEFEYNE